MKSSAMRDLMAITEHADVISLAGGLPDTSTFPARQFAEIFSRIGSESSAQALQYGPTEGLRIARDAAAAAMQAEEMAVEADEILITTGGQQVLDLVAKTLLDPGDIVIAEAPTYPGAVPVFCSYEAEVIQIELDEQGMKTDELELVLERLTKEGRRPKFIYTVPTFQNPGGVTLSLERRRKLVELAHRYEILVLEDSPYALLRFDGEPLPTLHSLDGGQFVIYLGTFSKILSPGLRLGWAVAPRPVLVKMNLGKQAADLCSSSVGQFFVAEFFADDSWLRYVKELSQLYRTRRDVMLTALSEHFPPESSWSKPAGGMFIWATLPDYIDTTDLLARALRERVAFVPGRAAFLDGRGGSSMRLNFSGSDEDTICEGIRRIGKVITEQISLYGTLTGSAGGHTAESQRGDSDLAEVLRLGKSPRGRDR